MAYMSQELKTQIAPKVKAILKKYGIKGTLAVSNHSSLVLNIKSGRIDFIENVNRVCSQSQHQMVGGFRPITQGHVNVNPYHYEKHFDSKALAFLSEIIPALNKGNWDKSDIQSDYFNVGWYVDVNIGRWNTPYEVTA